MGETALGDRLRAARERAGLTLRQAGAATGHDYAYLARIETGQRKHPSAELVLQLAKLYRIDVGDLLGDPYVAPMRDYFERTLGVSTDEADFLAGLIEYQLHKPKGGTFEKTDEG